MSGKIATRDALAIGLCESFVAKRMHRIDAHCPMRRNVACRQRHAHQQEGDRNKRQRIEPTNAKQQRA